MLQVAENGDKRLGTKIVLEILVAEDGFCTMHCGRGQWLKFLNSSLPLAQVSFFWKAFRE
jgi:hypothetical protein